MRPDLVQSTALKPGSQFTIRTVPVITICSHCKRVISQTLQGGPRCNGDGEEPVSHGICSKCLVILESKIRERPEYALVLPPEEDLTVKVKEHG